MDCMLVEIKHKKESDACTGAWGGGEKPKDWTRDWDEDTYSDNTDYKDDELEDKDKISNDEDNDDIRAMSLAGEL